MLFYTVQESSNSSSIVALASSIALTNPGQDLCILCTEEAQKYIEAFELKGINLTFLKAPDDFSVKSFIQNWLYISEHVVKTYNEGVFVHCRMLMCGPFQISAELEKQQFAFMKNEFSSQKYSFNIFYMASLELLSKIKKKFESEKEIIESEELEKESEQAPQEETKNNSEEEAPQEETKNNSEEEAPQEAPQEETKNNSEEENLKKKSQESDKKFLKVWFDLPKDLADYDDGKICAEEFFDGRSMISTEQFIVKKGWDHNKVSPSPLMYEETPIFIASIDFNPRFNKINGFILDNLLKSNDKFLPIIELLSFKNLHIYVPKTEGIAHWDRSADPSLNQLFDVITNAEIKPQQFTREYFECSKYVLYDKPGIKWVTNYLNDIRGVIYYDYDNEMVEFWKTYKKPAVFGGYIVPYHAVLDDFSPEVVVEKNGSISSKDLSVTFETEEEYKAHLTKLNQYETCEFDSDTPKYRISECVKLGVKPVVVDDTVIIESDQFSEEYYNTKLSLSAMRSTLLQTIF